MVVDMLKAITMACALACVAAPALAQEQAQPQAAAPEETCGILQVNGDRSAYVPVPGYSILRSIPPLARPAGQSQVDAVVCIRASVFLGPVDYRVVTDLGVPLFIRTADRIAVLELSDNQLRVRFTRGQPTPAEAEALRTALDRAQDEFHNAHPQRTGQ
jgi:hypothetical protein